jgi:hypothetical protein
VLQASYTRLDHVVLVLGNLFDIYASALDEKVDRDICTAIVKSLEKRWKAADQPIFLLAVILNPFIRMDAFNPVLFPRTTIWNFVKAACLRFWKKTADASTFSALGAYLDRSAEFSEEAMELQMHKLQATNEVRTPLSFFFRL